MLSWALSVPVMLTWPGYDPVSQSISVLVNAPNGWLQTAAFALQGALGLPWAVGVARVLGGSVAERRRVRWLLGILALLALAFAVFPTDPGERGTSLPGRLHLATFAAYAVVMPLTMRLLAPVMARDPSWSGLARSTRLTGWALTLSILAVPATVFGPLRPWLGLLERAYVALPSVWQVAVSVVGLRILGASLARPAAAGIGTDAGRRVSGPPEPG